MERQYATDEQPVQVPGGSVLLEGTLGLPAQARGAVLFAHGSGSSRRSRRNRAVAAALRANGLATLLIDLLSEEEAKVDARTGHLRFDIDLLAGRLLAATDWLRQQTATSGLAIGYFGASTGAAAALVAAARRPDLAGAVVSRGGRPDLAGPALAQVRAPTLLIVGSHDEAVVELNMAALRRLPGIKELVLVEGASHLFEEPGALEQVAVLAGDWFVRSLQPAAVSQQ